MLYCTTSDWSFGPVFDDSDDHDADERAEAFVRWLATCQTWLNYESAAPLIMRVSQDPRELSDVGLQHAYADWLAQEIEQWTREEAQASGE